MKRLVLSSILFFACLTMFGQDSIPREKRKAIVNSNNLTVNANEKLQSNQFIDAEADYRRAISKNGENAVAKYNLGNAYYNKDSYSEAFSRYKQAGEIAQNKTQKHKVFHNMGNVFMKNKEYEKAVEAYKNALRNNPTDDETRYNLALAKEMLKKQEQQNDQEKDDQEKQDDQNNKGEGDNEKKDNEGEEKKEEENDKGDKGDNKENEQEGDDGDQKKENPQDKQQNKPNDQQKGKPRQSQLSPQQVKALLQAMNNEEKKVQEKMNAAKVKGAKTRNEKDW